MYQQYKDMLLFNLNFTISCALRKFRVHFINIITAYCLRMPFMGLGGRSWRQKADWMLNILLDFYWGLWSVVDPSKGMGKKHFSFRSRFNMHFLNASYMQNIFTYNSSYFKGGKAVFYFGMWILRTERLRYSNLKNKSYVNKFQRKECDQERGYSFLTGWL